MVVSPNASIINFSWFTLNYFFHALQHIVMVPVPTVSGNFSSSLDTSQVLLGLSSPAHRIVCHIVQIKIYEHLIRYALLLHTQLSLI